MNRRQAISALGGAALSARAFAQQAPQRVTPEAEAARLKPGTRPILCVYSGCLAKIPYPELPEIVNSLGYEGIDLTVMPGGHVDPSKYMVELDRAFQTFNDAGIEVPMVTTSFTSPSQPYAYAIFYVSGELGARFCRLGDFPPALPSDASAQITNARAGMMRDDLVQFAAMGTRCKVVPLLANHAGNFPGRSVPEVETILTGVDPKMFGYCFDPAQAVIESHSASGWEPALQAALPRLAAVALSDVALDPDPHPCPIGEGVIDWKKFFAALAAAHFHGPISMHMEYNPASAPNAMKKDLAFARSRVDDAWPIS